MYFSHIILMIAFLYNLLTVAEIVVVGIVLDLVVELGVGVLLLAAIVSKFQ